VTAEKAILQAFQAFVTTVTTKNGVWSKPVGSEGKLRRG
jgi:hypothetical protein